MAISQRAESEKRAAQAGFTLVSLLALLPLVLTVTVALSVMLTGVRRKAWAQSRCVWQAAATQEALGKALSRLLALNPAATRLRAQRVRAELRLRIALASGMPPAIAAAKAERLAVVLAQSFHGAKQQAILLEAEGIRRRAETALASSTREWRESPVRARRYFTRALAVEPIPLNSPTPNYAPVSSFTERQQVRLHFETRLSPAGAPLVRQPTECALTLESKPIAKEKKWRLRVLGTSASAAWNSSSYSR